MKPATESQSTYQRGKDRSIDLVHDPDKYAPVDALDKRIPDVDGLGAAHRRVNHLAPRKRRPARESIRQQISRDLGKKYDSFTSRTFHFFISNCPFL